MTLSKIILVATLSLFLGTVQANPMPLQGAPEPIYRPGTVTTQCGDMNIILNILNREFYEIVVVAEGDVGNGILAVRENDGSWSLYLNPSDRPDKLCLVSYGGVMRYL